MRVHLFFLDRSIDISLKRHNITNWKMAATLRLNVVGILAMINIVSTAVIRCVHGLVLRHNQTLNVALSAHPSVHS